MPFMRVVDRGQSGDWICRKSEAEMIRIVTKVPVSRLLASSSRAFETPYEG